MCRMSLEDRQAQELDGERVKDQESFIDLLLLALIGHCLGAAVLWNPKIRFMKMWINGQWPINQTGYLLPLRTASQELSSFHCLSTLSIHCVQFSILCFLHQNS